MMSDNPNITNEQVKEFLEIRKKAARRAFLVPFFSTIFAAILLQFLWNVSLVPAVDFVNEIGFFQSIGILFVARFVFK